MSTGFLMNRYVLGLSRYKFRHILIRVFNHQMHIKRKLRLSLQAFHNSGTKAYIGNKVAVHNIHMDEMSPASFYGRDIGTQL